MFAVAIVSATLGLVPPLVPCGPIPSEAQLRRLKFEVCVLVHLGVPTFLGRDVATASDDRAIFRLADVDAASWVEDLRAMDLDGLVLVGRDDDGFSLADTAILPTIAKSLAEAAIPMGISVGGGGTTGTTGTILGEVADLCRRFGPFFEVRIGSEVSAAPAGARDVACPGACMVSADGPDLVAAPIGVPVPTPDGPWRGIERTMSIRPSWYWRLTDDERIRSVAELEDAWFASVGQGEPLLLGIPADREGRFPRGDVERVVEFRRRLATVFDRDLARDATASASAVRGVDGEFGAARAIDGSDTTCWASDDGVREAWLELLWPGPVTFGIVELREPADLGSRFERWWLEARIDREWQPVAKGRGIGFRRTVRFPPVRSDGLRLRMAPTACGPALARISVFAAPPEVQLASGETTFVNRTVATLASDRTDARILYTIDGRDPARSGIPFAGGIPIETSCVLRAVAVDASGRAGYPITVRFTRTDRDAFLAAVPEENPPETGLELELHDGVGASLAELADRRPRSSGTIDDVRLPDERPRDRFALVFRGFLRVPADGLYTFSLRSDDASRLYLHNRLVIDRDGPQVYDVREGRMALRRGLHPIRVEYAEFEGRESLSLSWSVAGAPFTRIPADAYAR